MTKKQMLLKAQIKARNRRYVIKRLHQKIERLEAEIVCLNLKGEDHD